MLMILGTRFDEADRLLLVRSTSTLRASLVYATVAIHFIDHLRPYTKVSINYSSNQATYSVSSQPPNSWSHCMVEL